MGVKHILKKKSSKLLLLLTRLSCPTVRPQRRQPTRLPRPWDSPGKNTGVGCHFLLQCMKVKSESEVAQSCPTPSDPMDCNPPGSSVHGFSRQEYRSGVPLPSLSKLQKGPINGNDSETTCFSPSLSMDLPGLESLAFKGREAQMLSRLQPTLLRKVRAEKHCGWLIYAARRVQPAEAPGSKGEGDSSPLLAACHTDLSVAPG